jgi:hypothetical protein
MRGFSLLLVREDIIHLLGFQARVRSARIALDLVGQGSAEQCGLRRPRRASVSPIETAPKALSRYHCTNSPSRVYGRF